MTSEAGASRRIYGRGFYDGQRKVLESMNNARVMALERGLSGVARKVLEATPISDPWSIPQICSELQRVGASFDRHVIAGCLASLLEKGLVREPKKGHFARMSPKLKLAAVRVETPTLENNTMPTPSVAAPAVPAAPAAVSAPSAAAAAPAASKPDPIKRVGDLAAEVRGLSSRLSAIATEIEDVALDMESRLAQSTEETQKLRQLQQLLRSLGV